MAKTSTKNSNSSANLGFEAKLWLAADKLRTLATLRDTLLPKLLSRELSVTETKEVAHA
jgi:hypothetical protein